jgi:hypothetical protein
MPSFIRPEVTSAFLGVLAVAATWFATWLARRGKKEDNRIVERGQAFDQLLELANQRRDEIVKLKAEADKLRGEASLADGKREELRASWESRWDRQMQRCRDITAPLVATIKHLQESPASRMFEVIAEAEEVVRRTEEHNERDHGLDASHGPPEG